MLVQTPSPLHHCSSGSTNSLPPGILQPEPASAPTGGPTTNSYIAQPGTAYASAGHEHHWTPQPRLVYWSPGNYCTLRQRPVPVENPPRRTSGVYLPTSTPTSHHQGIPTNINRSISLIPAGDFTPKPVRGMPQTQQPSTYAALPPTRGPRQCFSVVASDRRCRSPSHTWEMLRGSFCSSSTHSHRLPIARTPLRKERTNAPSLTVSAVIDAARKFSDSDSQDSSSAIPSNSTPLSDVPHQDD